MTELIFYAIPVFAAGSGFGIWFYRYALKHNPAKLEAWAKEIRAKSDELKAKFTPD